jgi:hypothetical protein
MEAVVVYPEVMRQLMKDGDPNLLADLVVAVADRLDRLLVDADLVGKDQVVAFAAPVSERHAVVKAE